MKIHYRKRSFYVCRIDLVHKYNDGSWLSYKIVTLDEERLYLGKPLRDHEQL